MIEPFCLDQLLRHRNFTFFTGPSIDAGEDFHQESVAWRDESGPLEISIVSHHGATVYRLSHGREIIIDVLPQGHLTVKSAPDIPKSSVDHFIADQVLPRVIAYSGEFVIHAGALECENSTILLLGASGMGKSTLAASMHHAGWTLLGDDAIVISHDNGDPLACAVYPSLRLFPDSIAALLPEDATTAYIAHYSDKQRLSVPIVKDHAAEAAPIKAIFVLEQPCGDEIGVTGLSIAAACMAMVENSFALDPTDPQRARQRLEAASNLARQVPAFALSYPRDYARLPEVRDAIIGALRGS